ncbi:MAG: hypothetical protein K9M07_01945 [Simkaniaceae bacterium]|nr:hypothetical protein [Simkaniaceae bacterium]MCF7851983.1 hypothetical protein [Simkaniaceae bacterium]
MRLEIDCSWNGSAASAKHIIRFDHAPKSLFNMQEEEIISLQMKMKQLAEVGPSYLEAFEGACMGHPKSLYAGYLLNQVYQFFQLHDESLEWIHALFKKFPGQLISRCLIASIHLKDGDTEAFCRDLENRQVLRALFPERKQFFFEEALLFHGLWAKVFHLQGDGIQSTKHQKLCGYIAHSFQLLHVS